MVGRVTHRRSVPVAVSSRPRRVLVISNETVEAEILRDTIAARADGTQVLVVAPALNTRLRHWLSDEDPARRAAERRLARAPARPRAAGGRAARAGGGVEAAGGVGAADPLVAIEDALATFAADELLIATHPEARSNWLAHDLVGRARARLSPPVPHLLLHRGR